MDWIVLIVLGAIWGASYLFIKVGGAEIPPLTFAALRTLIAGLVLIPVILIQREKFPARDSGVWKWLAAMGLLNSVIPYTLITWGETHISSGLAAILVGAMPIFTVLLAHWLTHDEKLTPMRLIGVLVGFVGVVILFLPDLQLGLQQNLAGGLAVVIAAVSYAFAATLARRHLREQSSTIVAMSQLLIAAIVLVPFSLLLDQPYGLRPSPAALGSLVVLAVMGTAIAYVMYYWLVANVGATRTSLVTYVSPVIAVFLGALALNERLDWTTFIGLIAIIAGVAIVTRSPTTHPVLATAVEPN